MNDSVVAVPADRIALTASDPFRVALVGPPNSGKSTLFNQLTGLRQRIANYPGVTVEKKTGQFGHGPHRVELIDLPGLYTLTPHSLDERIAVDVLYGQIEGDRPPDALIAVVDATRLGQGLYLLRQILELEQPMVVALTLTDAARASGIDIDIDALQRRLGCPVVPVVATTGDGLDDLREAIRGQQEEPVIGSSGSWPALAEQCRSLSERFGDSARRIEIERALIDPGGDIASRLLTRLDADGHEALIQARIDLFGDQPPRAEEARLGHDWARRIVAEVQSETPQMARIGQRLLNLLNRPLPGTMLFLGVMLVVFQAVFAWATPLMDAIDAGTSAVGARLGEWLGDGLLASFLVDGVIAGVGSVIIFLPQILILFAFIIVMEDSGYLARSAFLMDRLMRSLGLSGQSVIPLLSGFACAVPAIMATRVIPTRRQRLATILATPFMTCSARLPIYALLIGAFVPLQSVGTFNLQGLVLFGLYLLGIVGGTTTAWLVNRFLVRGELGGFAMSLPPIRWPNMKTVLFQLTDRGRVFLRRAGTVIFAVAVVIWALATFPRAAVETQAATVEAEQQQAADQLAQSFLGRTARVVEPVFRPLGWDWKVSAAVIAGFPAREVVVAVLGTLYAVGDEADEERLSQRLKAATWPDGRPVFTLPMVLGLLVFYAWCLQCVATVAVIRRETNSWRWPALSWAYMTGLGYLGALLIYQFGS